jgi:hypothetical protein
VKAGSYTLRIRGTLSPDWADWFEGMDIRQEAEGQTVLEGPVLDQAALHGLLERIRDLNLTLISVNPVPEEPANDSREQGE